jgi:hypothetical protein
MCISTHGTREYGEGTHGVAVVDEDAYTRVDDELKVRERTAHPVA